MGAITRQWVILSLCGAAAMGNAADDAGLGLDEVVVTATVFGGNKMQQSLSVSSLDAEDIKAGAARNSAEALRAIPGVHVEASGGEGNANVSVRGVPISAGGARYVQWQEDGLPILQFGDIAFATADQFVRIDKGVERIEVVRGGSASTAASGAPGGVINLISAIASDAQAFVGLSSGVNFDQQRLDFLFSAPHITADTDLSLSGFYRRGEGLRDANVSLERGGQIKLQARRVFPAGSVQIYGKVLQDQVPMLLPVPVRLSKGRIQAYADLDPRRANLYSAHWGQDHSLAGDNSTEQHSVNDGLQVRSRAVGGALDFEFGDGLRLTDKWRWAKNSGRFIGVFPADNEFTQGPFNYASGPMGGQSYTGPVITAAVFNTQLGDLGNRQNDLRLQKTWQLSSAVNLTPAIGLYANQQDVALTWNFNHYLISRSETAPNLINTPATSNNVPGLIAGGTDVWGGCCNRDINAQYTTIAPYLNLTWQLHALTLDASLRRDKQDAEGLFNQASQQQYTSNKRQKIAYQLQRSSYSLGANYLFNADLALFARQSRGFAFNADRIMFNGFALDGSSDIPSNELTQTEAGLKWRSGAWQSFITLFEAKTTESNYEATTQLFTQRNYRGRGFEWESSWHQGGLSVRTGLTYTDASIKNADVSALKGKTPRRQAPWVFQLTPMVNLGEATLGAAILGSDSAWGDDANSIHLSGYATVNLFARYSINDQLEINASANNVFDRLAFTEVEGDGHAARALDGRSLVLGINYNL